MDNTMMNLLAGLNTAIIGIWLGLILIAGGFSLRWVGQWLQIETRSYFYSVFTYLLYFFACGALLFIMWIGTAATFTSFENKSLGAAVLCLLLILTLFILPLVYKKMFNTGYWRSFSLMIATTVVNAFVLSPFLLAMGLYKGILFLFRHQPRPFYKVAIAISFINFISLVFIIIFVLSTASSSSFERVITDGLIILVVNLLVSVLILRQLFTLSWWKALITHVINTILFAALVTLSALLLAKITPVPFKNFFANQIQMNNTSQLQQYGHEMYELTQIVKSVCNCNNNAQCIEDHASKAEEIIRFLNSQALGSQDNSEIMSILMPGFRCEPAFETNLIQKITKKPVPYATSTASTNTQTPVAQTDNYVTTSLDQIESHLPIQALIVRNNSMTYIGWIITVNPDNLMLKTMSNNTEITYQIPLTEITSLKTLKPQS